MNRLSELVVPPALAPALMSLVFGTIILIEPSLGGTPSMLTGCSSIPCNFTAECGDHGCEGNTQCDDGCSLQRNGGSSDCMCN